MRQISVNTDIFHFLLFLLTVRSQTYYPLCNEKWHSLTVTVVYLYEADVLVQ